ncbi:hypothetical protein FVEN_g12753 [Fusarium venenatum]|nr:hypothetical protein FVEN_g12753 [Fusarium venenatum]
MSGVSEDLQEKLSGLRPSMLESAAGGLLRANVSSWSQEQLPQDVKKLFDALVYRLNLFCTSSTPRPVTIE